MTNGPVSRIGRTQHGRVRFGRFGTCAEIEWNVESPGVVEYFEPSYLRDAVDRGCRTEIDAVTRSMRGLIEQLLLQLPISENPPRLSLWITTKPARESRQRHVTERSLHVEGVRWESKSFTDDVSGMADAVVCWAFLEHALAQRIATIKNLYANLVRNAGDRRLPGVARREKNHE